MTRFALLVFGVLACALVCVPVSADDPPRKLTPAEREELEAQRRDRILAGQKAYQAGKYAEAVKSFREALEVVRRLYPKAEYPDGHADLATAVSNLAAVMVALGKPADAEPLAREALDMQRRLYKGDHNNVAVSLNNLATLYAEQGKLVEAEPLYKEALEMTKRLFPGDHPDVARGMNNLASLYDDQGKLAEAESLYKDVIAMQRRIFKGDHPNLASTLNNLAFLHRRQGKFADAEPLAREAVAMQKRLFKGDHPSVVIGLSTLATLHEARRDYAEAESAARAALEMSERLFKGDHPIRSTCLNTLASVFRRQGKFAEAEPLCKEALEMTKRLFPGDHPTVSSDLDELGFLYHGCGKLAEAERLSRASLAMDRRLLARYAGQKSEGEALTFVSSLPLHRDAFFSLALAAKLDPRAVYDELWASKGAIARVYELRLLQARAAARDPRAAGTLAEVTDTRRRRAELLLAPALRDPAARKEREDEVRKLEAKIAQLDEAVRPLLPSVARFEKLNAAAPVDLQKVLPPDTAVVDFLRYVRFEYDPKKPGVAGEKRTPRYLAFVVTRDGIARTELGTAPEIETAVSAWRTAITAGKEIPPALPSAVRELVWAKVRKELPEGVKTVYLCPDSVLCRIPWGALPGDKPNTVLLEDYAVATIPHAAFLLDKLWPQDPVKDPPTGALVVGGVGYDAEPAPDAAGIPAGRRDPLVAPGRKPGWALLPGTAAEAAGVSAAAASKQLTVREFQGDKATPAAVLTALPKARYAHFATHGFFADPSFRGPFQLDEKDFQKSWRGERIGRSVHSPMVMTGLVCAGANNPKTAGRGIVTGEQLIDLDLSGLELAVLSACETGLGDTAGGEGVYGLQRAFHYAGTRDVVASLWKVPDRSTAALMALFYRNLWTQNLGPMEALRQAQLEIYRNPGKVPELAKGFRGKFEEVPGSVGEAEGAPTKDGKAHPLFWAAFALSGPGR
jgi:CHAT domain-containing protein/tetratricopeptide (TPR) repeat protein